MRYDNWDVILFPEDSNIPIQEYRTACFFSRDEGKLPSMLGGPAIMQQDCGTIRLTTSAQMATSYLPCERTLDQ